MTRAPTARLFLAVDPPARMREQLAAWARSALGAGRAGGTGRPLRVLDPEVLHLTICFLGARPIADIETLAGVLGECVAPVGELSVGAPLWLPPRRPRALAVELHDPAGELKQLHEAVLATVAGAIAWEPEGGVDAPGSPHPHPARPGEPRSRRRPRRFRPHITLARMREGVAPSVRELPPTPALAFAPAELILYRSWLDPDGASYEPLASAALA